MRVATWLIKRCKYWNTHAQCDDRALFTQEHKLTFCSPTKGWKELWAVSQLDLAPRSKEWEVPASTRCLERDLGRGSNYREVHCGNTLFYLLSFLWTNLHSLTWRIMDCSINVTQELIWFLALEHDSLNNVRLDCWLKNKQKRFADSRISVN